MLATENFGHFLLTGILNSRSDEILMNLPVSSDEIMETCICNIQVTHLKPYIRISKYMHIKQKIATPKVLISVKSRLLRFSHNSEVKLADEL
jgi:hypothetical protein